MSCQVAILGTALPVDAKVTQKCESNAPRGVCADPGVNADAMSVVACPPPTANASFVSFQQHEAPVRPRFPQCAGEPLIASAVDLDLHAWSQ